MTYDYIKIPKALQEKYPNADEVVDKIEKNMLVQYGVQNFRDEEIAKNWAETALNREDDPDHPFIVVRREGRTELYQPKK